MPESQWQARIEGALAAHFKQPDGSSRPGTDYAVGLRRGDETHRIMVRAYLGDTVTSATRKDTRYQQQTVLDFVFDRLAAGWTPAAEALPVLTILDPRPTQNPLPLQRGRLRRLFGG